MAPRTSTTRLCSFMLAAPIVGVMLSASGLAHAANPTYYVDLASFQVDVTSSVTDPYSNPAYVFIQGNAQMSAVLGETDYETTGFQDLNIVSGGTYCAGCNGSFELSFQNTSVGDASGVTGVGLDILTNSPMLPYFAFITFADGTTEDIPLPAGGFWGVSAPERIERIHFGLSMGGTTQAGSFQIDNLIVGDGFDMTPCGDGIPTPDEECDDAGESADCDADCTFAICGDGTINMLAGEACDDEGPSADCNADCTALFCGDGQVNMAAGEECDDAGETISCDSDCTAVSCGDGVANLLAGEECDDGAQSPGCDTDCTTVVCGDGIENNSAGEFCDDGNNDDGDGCSAVCTNEEPSSTTDVSGSSDSGSSGGESTSADSGDTDVGTTGGGTAGDTAGDTTGDTGNTFDDTTGGGSASASETTTSGPAGDSSGAPGAEGEAGGTGGSNAETGCGCSTDDLDNRRGAAWSVIGLLGLGAVTRRRRPR